MSTNLTYPKLEENNGYIENFLKNKKEIFFYKKQKTEYF